MQNKGRRCTYHLSPDNGFTLVELLIAASILGMIALAVLSAFATGFHAFERVQAFGGARAQVLLALEEMEKDLRNTFRLAQIPFEGGTQKAAFPAIVTDVDDEGNGVVSPGRKSYYFDSQEKVLMVQEEDYVQAHAESPAAAPVVLAPIENLKFQYYFYIKTIKQDGKESIEYGWKDVWGQDDGMPRGVKIELAFKDGEEERTFTRTVFIPAGGETVTEQPTEGDDPEEEGDA